MHKLTVTLKQHTPLIHFQHDQEGATLRASEVKPKLDRFLLGTNKYSEIEDGLQKFLIGYNDELDKKGAMQSSFESGKYALDYKLAIKNVGNKIETSDLPSYFADGGIGISYTTISLTFTSKYKFLIEQIRQVISDFFIINNFGNRASKGYGCFTVASIDGETIPLTFDDVEDALKYYNQIVYCKYCVKDKNPLSIMADDYQLLKSGKNYPYKKSIIFGYAIKNGIRWEKRKIKRRIFQEGTYSLRYNNEPIYGVNEDESSWYDPQEDDFQGDETTTFKYFFVRAMLGLPNHYEFMLQGSNEKLIVDVKRAKPVDITDQYDVIIDKKAFKFSDEIERFKSPITFKIIAIGAECRIYMIAENDDIKSTMSKKNFVFCMENVKVNNNKIAISTPFYEKILTPDKFSYKDFLKYATDYRRNDNIPTLKYKKISED